MKKRNYSPLEFSKFNIQFFGEGETDTEDKVKTAEEKTETKTFSQEDLDSIVKSRLARERKKWEEEQNVKINDLVNKKVEEKETFKNMTEEERKNAEFEKIKADYEKQKAELVKAQKELLLNQSRSEIRTAWNDDKMPVFNEMDSLIDLLSKQDEETKTSCYKSLKKFYETVRAKVRKEEFNQDTPSSGNGGKVFATDALVSRKNKEIESRNSGTKWGK